MIRYINELLPDEALLQKRIRQAKSKEKGDHIPAKPEHQQEQQKQRERAAEPIQEYERLISKPTPAFRIEEYLDHLIEEGNLMCQKSEYQGMLNSHVEWDIRMACRYLLESVLRDRLYEQGYEMLWEIGKTYFSKELEYFTVLPPEWE